MNEKSFKIKTFKYHFVTLKKFFDFFSGGIFFWAIISPIVFIFLSIVIFRLLGIGTSGQKSAIWILPIMLGISSLAWGPFVLGFILYIVIAIFFFLGVFFINIGLNSIEIYKYYKLKKGESKNQKMMLEELGKKVEKYRNEGYILPEDLEKILK